MNTTKEIIRKIKQMLGMRFDRELIADMRLTLRDSKFGPTIVSDWKRHNSITKELLEYCILKRISIYEILGVAQTRNTAPAHAECTSAAFVKTLRSPVPFYICKTPILSTPKKRGCF